MIEMDWNQARAFATTATEGSLSAAARKLGLTQPTLSRQIAALEADLSVTLFDRVGKRLVLTDTGLSLVAHARAMTSAAQDLALAAAGQIETVEGPVTISATDGIAAYLLPSIVARIRTAAPEITLIIVASDKLSDLRRREADIAIRHVRPVEPELVGRLVRDTTAHFYAARSWVRRHGVPARLDDLLPEHLIGFAPIQDFAALLASRHIDIGADRFRLAADSGVVTWQMVRRGLGVGIMLREIAAATPDVVQVLLDAPSIEAPIWLVAHRELRTSRRIRVVFDLLFGELSALPTEIRGRRKPS